MNDWTNVEDRLPEYGYPVLGVARKNFGDTAKTIVRIVRRTRTDAEGEHWEFASFKNEGNPSGPITHWRHLP